MTTSSTAFEAAKATKVGSETTAWKNRIVLNLGPKQSKRLKKGLRTQTMKDKVWYEIIPSTVKDLFLADGTRVTKAQLRSILRRM